MADHDQADRLNRQWDEYVQTPRQARGSSPEVDPTLHEIHASASNATPDPAFRTQLRRQLEREAAYRVGRTQGVADTQPLPAAPIAPPPATRSRTVRPIEILAIAALLAIVGAAIFWSIGIQDTDDPEPTQTIELAATTPNEVPGTPGASETVVPTDTVEAGATGTSEPTPTVTETSEPSPTVTVSPAPTETPTPSPTDEPTATATDEASPTATATETVTPSPTATQNPSPTASVTAPGALLDACDSIAGGFDSLTAPIGDPTLAPDITRGVPASVDQIEEIDDGVDAFVDCLDRLPQQELRSEVMASLADNGLDRFDQASIAQDIDNLRTQEISLSDHRLIDDDAVVTITMADGTVFVAHLVPGDEPGEWIVDSLSLPPAVEDVPPTVPTGSSGGNQGGGNGSGSNSGSSDGGSTSDPPVITNDDDDDSGSGSDDGGDDDDGAEDDGDD